jgi:hypothetical protein
MNLRAFVFATASVSACLCGSAVRAAAWTAVPGAPDVEVDLASLHIDRGLATVWVRWWGRPASAPELAGDSVRQLRVNRSAVRTEFDCGRRTMRTLAVHAYDASGSPVFMSSVPGPVQAVSGQELAWTYDAVCEAARAGARF